MVQWTCILAHLAVVVAAAPGSSSIKHPARSVFRQYDHHSQSRNHQQLLMSPLLIRGGNSDPSTYNVPQSQTNPLPQDQDPYQQYQQQPYDQQQQQQQYEYLSDNPIPADTDEDGGVFQETFQDRIDTWRNYQLQHASEQRDSVSPRDEKGRMKLFVSISKASRSITFFILMWRNVHLYEVVDQHFKGTLRFLIVLPLTLLFIANMAGVVASVSAPGHSSKKRLKAILNLDKLVEVILIIWHVGKLLFTTSHLVPREIYISNIIHSVFFILQCQTVTRFVWDETFPMAGQTQTEPQSQSQQSFDASSMQQPNSMEMNPSYEDDPFNNNTPRY